MAARTPPGFQIFAMWVAPDTGRRGVGGRLLDAALAWVERAEPGAAVRIEVNPRQEAARRLYLSRGFRPTGRSRPLDHTPSERIEEMVRPGAPGPM